LAQHNTIRNVTIVVPVLITSCNVCRCSADQQIAAIHGESRNANRPMAEASRCGRCLDKQEDIVELAWVCSHHVRRES
jgi:hypothetical protein